MANTSRTGAEESSHMLSFETLQVIADSVNPTLGAITLLLPAFPAVRARTPLRRWYLLLLAALVIVYGLMFIEHRHNVWLFGKYSTHTALATALVVLWSGAGKVIFRVGVVTVVAYGLLEVYQHYHTPLDVVTTAAVTAAMLFGIIYATAQPAVRHEAKA